MTPERLTWKEIEERYDQQWVELVDYDWPEGDFQPRSGVVRTHAADKKAFHRDCRREPVPEDSADLFVAKKQLLMCWFSLNWREGALR
jgi:hypothetical protein